jgi:hypothetical protein
VAYVRTVRTASGAMAVQIVYSKRRGARRMEHVGSAHDERELEALKAAAAQRLAGGQQALELEVGAGGSPVSGPGPLPIVASRMGHLWEALCRAYELLGFDQATGRDPVFRDLVLARIIEPTSKADSLRVLGEVGVTPPAYRTLNRRLPGYAKPEWRQRIAGACAANAGLGPASLVLYDVTTLYFETDAGDGFREPGFSKERRLEPQITIGLLTDATGFPLMVEVFEGNRAETTTMLPTITAFMAAHQLRDVTVVADAGMISDANKKAIEAAGLSFILGMRIPVIPYVVTERLREHPDEQLPDGLVLTQPWPAGPVAKAEKAVAGKVPVKRNRFIRLVGADKSVNRDLEAKARALAGWKGYITNLPNPDAGFVISAYHRLFQIEASFRMSKHDLAARPIYHHKRESIQAHLNVVFAALAVSRLVEERTGWSIRRFVRTARRYRTVQIRAGQQLLTAEDPIPTDLLEALALIR